MNKIEHEELFGRNVVDLVGFEDIEKKLKKGQKLRVKLGFDPTGERLHIGRAITLWKLRQFQDAGHKITFVIGDFTARIGDTSDKEAERQQLSAENVRNNFKNYHRQLSMVLNMDKVEVFQNARWFSDMRVEEFFKLTSLFTIQQMIERDNFAKRIDAGKPVGLQETLYPLLQGYDSVEMKTDMEVGGTDQLFNMLAGRTVQKAYGLSPQAVMTFPLLEGLDGRKMSTSWGNCIYIDDLPLEMYGKVMSVRDELIPKYFRLCTDVDLSVIDEVEKNLARGDNARDTKASLSRAIVGRYHGEKVANEVEEEWNRQFRDGGKPAHIEQIVISAQKPHNLVDFISDSFHLSKSEARRIINQNGVRVDDSVVTESEIELRDNMIIQVGKRRYKKIKIS